LQNFVHAFYKDKDMSFYQSILAGV